ncbi:phospho-sugar mutase [Acholeplasma granularum]|uniref:phospho-sugar mutase n=1 Tax=Acholeplasma granularum TaxID=264635 RepID=UPI000471E679|nr:phospho-sugar mutase [Acholeplasma granularum]
MTYQDKYNLWLNEESLTIDEKQTLLKMSEKEKEESFYQELSFGTGGIRGILGLGPNRINQYTIKKVTLGLVKYLKKTNQLNGVAIAYDNRFGSYEFAYEAAKVLAYNGMKSYIYKALRPTPMLSFLVRHFKTSAGIMLTASHNPKEYNGFKAYNSTGAQLSTEESNEMIKQIQTIDSPFNIKSVDNDLINWIDESLDPLYLNEVEKIAIQNDKKIVKIVYSPLHGTGGTVIPRLLTKNGYNVTPVKEQMIPDPSFSHTKSSNPEDKIAFESSIKLANQIDADVIFITDPDADRLGVCVKHNGEFITLNGNQTASLVLYYILSKKHNQKGIVYTTIVTTTLIKKIAESYNMLVGETLTGFKFIGEQAEKNKDKYPFIFGCEESYGSLVSDFVRDKDAVQAVYILAEIANTLKLENKTMIDYLEEIYQKYGYFREDTISLSFKGIEGLKRIDEITSYFRENDLILNGFEVREKIDYINGYINPHDIILPPSNVIKFLSEEGYVIFRPSGTEPKLKIYLSIKKNSLEESNLALEKLKSKVLELIEKI